ncbi:AMP-binding protein [Pseudoalteromonas maricaloris]|uniref:AMP-binding protein n=1 Tax=Pseudoalteromonas maricaloris TaxID=184924 RepID=UPI003C1CD9B4
MNKKNVKRLEDLFLCGLRKSSNDVAVIDSTGDYTYTDLCNRAVVIKETLNECLGNARNNVGVILEKGLSAYCALIGILMSKNVYVPLNPRSPCSRISEIISDACITTLIVGADMEGVINYIENVVVGVRIIRVETSSSEFSVYLSTSEVQSTMPDTDFTSSDLAYIIYTSGSTGKSKGVAISHASAIQCIYESSKLFDLSAEDRFAQFSELFFDVSIFEIFLCFCSGAKLVVPSRVDHVYPISFVKKHQISVWSSVPTMANNMKALNLLKDDALPSIRISIFCGEPLSCSLAQAWAKATPNGLTVNAYGPTEATIITSFHIFDPTFPYSSKTVPIGFPMNGFQYELLSEAEEPERQESGVLYLSGPQLFEGYWKNQSATQEVVEYRSGYARSKRKWYNTGDLVTYLPQSGLVFIERNDFQVKVRGHRVECAAVEGVIEGMPWCANVSVVPMQNEQALCIGLAAFVVCTEAIDIGRVKNNLEKYMPKYMVPENIIVVDSIPTTANGKTDRKSMIEMACKL